MENFNWTIAICYCSFALIALVLVVPVFIFIFRIGKKQTDEMEEYRKSIRDNGGVSAPAVIVAAQVLSSARARTSSPSFTVQFEVEVSPESGAPFRTKFRHSITPNGYKIENHEMISEYGKKVMVMYDPNETSRAYIDTYDMDNYRPARTIWRF
ncbi:MAG: hypothetical protein U0Z26_05755 [Anaerolineales bacterium]